MLTAATPAAALLYAPLVRAECNFNGSVTAGAQCATAGTGLDQRPSLTAEIHNIVNVLLIIVGIAAVIMIIVGGLRYVFSAGDANNTKGAKDTILYAAIGLVVAILAYAIVNFVLTRF